MTQHEITLPLIYKIKYLQSKRHSREQETYVREMLTVSITEVSTTDAPFAARYYSWGAPGDQIALRTFEGHIYKPVFDSRYSGKPAEYLLPQELREFSEQGRPYYNPLLRGLPQWVYENNIRNPAKDASEFSIVVSSERDKDLKTVMDAAEGILLVDGLTYERITTPVYKVENSGSYVSLSVDSPQNFRHQSAVNQFPLHRFEDANDYALAKFGRSIDPKMMAEIFVPEAFAFDDTTPAVLELIVAAVNNHRKSIGDAPQATGHAWFVLRDAVEKAALSRNAADIDAVFELTEAYRQSPGPRSDAVEKLNEAKERWITRDLVGPAL